MSQRLAGILGPLIEDLGYELWHLELVGGGSSRVLRVYIDSPDGIEMTDCETVSRELSANLDVIDPIPGEYSLEVSSPGMDRPLVTQAHFQRFVGRRASVRTYAPIDGRRRFEGAILGLENEELRLGVDGEEIIVPRSAIAKARLVPEFE